MKLEKEAKCIELFMKVLRTNNVSRQHTFDFLIGDKGTRLPVDAFFPEFNLVVEYMGEQHYNYNKFMNTREGREERRKKYDDLRTKKLKENGIKLIRFRYDEEFIEENAVRKLREVGINL